MTSKTFIFPAITILLLLGVRYFHSVLLFHTLVELTSVLVGIIMLVVVVNTRRFIKNDFILYLGTIYCAISMVDLMHALTVKGMPFFDIHDGEITVKLWLYARLFEAIALVFSTVLLTRKVNQAYVVVAALAIVGISTIGGFFIEQPLLFTPTGLSTTKIVGEYVVMVLLIAAIFLFHKKRDAIAPDILKYLYISLVMKFLAELSFTAYTDFFGFPFFLGHILKFLSFWMIYVAIIKTALKNPIQLLAQSSNSYDAIPISAIRVDNTGIIHQVNRAVLIEFSVNKRQIMYQSVHQYFHPTELTQDKCHFCDAITKRRAISNEEVYLPQYQRWFLISLASVDESNRHTGMIQSLTNISEQKYHERQLQSHKLDLENTVTSRTQELQESFDTLVTTQEKLLEAKKMAALGGLVAGVSHEINTPIGICFTAASHLSDSTQALMDSVQMNKMTRKSFDSYLDEAQMSSDLMLTNLQRASDLIGSFKQVAVDQSSEKQRRYQVKNYIQEILTSLNPALRKQPITVIFENSHDFDIQSSPSALSQIVTNLVMNALTHAFEGQESGSITISIECDEQDMVHLAFTDTGKGIPADHLSKIYEPFFTTKRGQGGSGLGMHIIFNLVNHSLQGQITCSSVVGQGTTFDIVFPRFIDEE